MKKMLLCVLLGSALFCSCATSKYDAYNKALSEVSWKMYCDKYGVCADEPTTEQEDFYLDCYVGSVEEENDFRNFKM